MSHRSGKCTITAVVLGGEYAQAFRVPGTVKKVMTALCSELKKSRSVRRIKRMRAFKEFDGRDELILLKAKDGRFALFIVKDQEIGKTFVEDAMTALRAEKK